MSEKREGFDDEKGCQVSSVSTSNAQRWRQRALSEMYIILWYNRIGSTKTLNNNHSGVPVIWRRIINNLSCDIVEVHPNI
eukprot:scaffold19036_cov91-Skeletonema_menzelii.AAC.1